MKIGLVFDIREDYGIDAEDLTFCDFNYLSDMQHLQSALELLGHYVVPLGSPREFAKRLRDGRMPPIDIVMNFGEGFLSRNREGIVPALCEIYDILYTGSDAFTMILTLDKHMTLLYAKSMGISTPKGFLYQPDYHCPQDIKKLILETGIQFPIVAKPNREGTSMGIALAHQETDLQAAVTNIVNTYHQEVRCDEYIEGHELAVPIIGTGSAAKALAIVEYCENDGNKIAFYTTEKKEHGNHRTEIKSFGQSVDQRIIATALRAHRGFQCCDISRVDMKLHNGVPYLLEITPIPSMNAGGTFEFCAAHVGLSYGELLNEILSSAMNRYTTIL